MPPLDFRLASFVMLLVAGVALAEPPAPAPAVDGRPSTTEGTSKTPPEMSDDDVPAMAAIGGDGRMLNFGFEAGTLADWTVAGDAWEGQPLRLAPKDPPQVQPTRHSGRHWLGYNPEVSDAGRGKLTSKPFKVSQRWASFLIGGASDNAVRVEVVEAGAGRVVCSASGFDQEVLQRIVIDLEPLLGREIFLRIIDESPEKHIAFDDFVFHGRQPAYKKVGRILQPN